MAPITLKGGCCCSLARYSVTTTLSDPLVLGRCNCTFCTKSGHIGLQIENPEADFKLDAPASEADLRRFILKNPGIEHMGCPKCGVHLFIRADFEYGGNRMKFFMLNAATLDQPQEGLELSKAKYVYVDGLHDDFSKRAQEPFPGGLP